MLLFCWTDACSDAFDNLKRALVSAPILAYPNFKVLFLLFVDASATGIGFTLGQVQDGKKEVIAYNDRGLNHALVEGIKKFQLYLHNRKFNVQGHN